MSRAPGKETDDWLARAPPGRPSPLAMIISATIYDSSAYLANNFVFPELPP
jgi:hypothetical protein